MVSVLAFSLGTGFSGQSVINDERESLLYKSIAINVLQECHSGAFTGKVTSIADHHGVADSKMVRVEGRDGSITLR